MELPKTKLELIIWSLGILGTVFLVPFIKKIMEDLAQRFIKRFSKGNGKFAGDKEVDDGSVADGARKGRKSGVNVGTIKLTSIFLIEKDYYRAAKLLACCKEAAYSLANYRMVDYGTYNIVGLQRLRETVLKDSTTFLDQIKEARFSSLDLNKSVINVQACMELFFSFTDQNIEKIEIIYKRIPSDSIDMVAHWPTHVYPIYRNYLQTKLYHIEEVYTQIIKLDKMVTYAEIKTD